MDCEFVFNSTTGAGSEVVTVYVEYEIDEDGIYNDNIVKIEHIGIDVTGLIHELDFNELEIEASMKLRDHIANRKQPSDFGQL